MPQASSTRLGVGELIRQLRARSGDSQRTLSGKVGRASSYIYKVEYGELDPSLRAFSAIAVALGMTPMEIWTVVHVEAQADATDHGLPWAVTPPAYADTHSADEAAGDE